jgi:hypothetical protein
MVRRGIRAIGRAPSAEANRLFDKFFGDWESESVKKVIAGWTAAEEDREMGVWRSESEKVVAHLPAELRALVLAAALKQSKRIRRLVRVQDAKIGAAKKREECLERDRFICEQWAVKRNVNRRYSVRQFRKDLLTAWKFRHSRQPLLPGTSPIQVPSHLWKSLRPRRKLLLEQSLRNIIDAGAPPPSETA